MKKNVFLSFCFFILAVGCIYAKNEKGSNVLMIFVWAVAFVASLFVLVKCSDWFVDSAETIGKFFHWPVFIIGVIIVAIGTSLPELASSLAAVFNGDSSIVVSNVLGSNSANIFLVFGLTALFGKNFKIKHDLMKTDLPFLIVSALMIVLMISDRKFTLAEAIICTGAMFFYIFQSLAQKKEPEKEIKKSSAEESVKKFLVGTEPLKVKLGIKPWILIILSPVGIALGAHYSIESVINLSKIIGIGTEIIAVTAIALGTSLPEVMVSISAARKGMPEMALGNVIGSNIFNTFAVMGIPGLIGRLEIPEGTITFVVPAFLAATGLFTVIMIDKRVFRVEGILMLGMYGYFIGHLYGIF